MPPTPELTSTTLQERVLNRLLQSVLPSDYTSTATGDDGEGDDTGERGKPSPHHHHHHRHRDHPPPFSPATMAVNFRRFNARVGIVFVAQHRLAELVSWQRPSHTLALAAAYGFVCLDPPLLFALPPAAALLLVLVPAFVARHPPAPSNGLTNEYSAHGPALAPPPAFRAVGELSRDFFRNLRDLQNTMDDYSRAHDHTLALAAPLSNFADEQLSSGVFLALLAACAVLFAVAPLLPLRFIFLAGGWGALTAAHPSMQPHVEQLLHPQQHDSSPAASAAVSAASAAAAAVNSWLHADITLPTVPETREVEIFELQRRTAATATATDPGSSEYEPWLFSPAPYEPLSPARIARDRPRGCRFLDDVRPPPGWDWLGAGMDAEAEAELCSSGWTVDLESLHWVHDRCLAAVQVEEEGERWVYDLDLHLQRAVAGTVGHEDYERGRGEWRRRRWVRTVRRKYLSGT